MRLYCFKDIHRSKSYRKYIQRITFFNLKVKRGFSLLNRKDFNTLQKSLNYFQKGLLKIFYKLLKFFFKILFKSYFLLPVKKRSI